MRYIIYKQGRSQDYILFSEQISFLDMMYKMNVERKNIVSAGHIHALNNDVLCSSHDSFKIKDRLLEEDEQYLKRVIYGFPA